MSKMLSIAPYTNIIRMRMNENEMKNEDEKSIKS